MAQQDERDPSANAESVAIGEAADGIDLHTDPDAPQDIVEDDDFILEAIPWRVAEALLALRRQVNAAAPNRSKLSDGTIGDTNHMKTGSDHNPHVIDRGIGVVTAMDVTHDPRGGCDAGRLADALHASRDPRIKYIIWNRRIANAQPVGTAAAWTWRPYNGRNPHDHHVHLSVRADKAQFDATDPWTIAVA